MSDCTRPLSWDRFPAAPRLTRWTSIKLQRAKKRGVASVTFLADWWISMDVLDVEKVFMEFLWNADINILNLCRFWESCSCVKILAFLLQGVKNLPKNLLSSVCFCFVLFFSFFYLTWTKMKQVPFFAGLIFICTSCSDWWLACSLTSRERDPLINRPKFFRTSIS